MNNMKLKVFALVAVLSLVFSCKKSETSETANVTPTVNNKEVSLEQDVKTLTGPNGEKITVAYFAEGTDVAVKVNKNNEGEHKLSAKGVTDNGNPLFTDGQVVWEMNSDGTSGTLTEKGGKVIVFK